MLFSEPEQRDSCLQIQQEQSSGGLHAHRGICFPVGELSAKSSVRIAWEICVNDIRLISRCRCGNEVEAWKSDNVSCGASSVTLLSKRWVFQVRPPISLLEE
jgi:hypothetical protein